MLDKLEEYESIPEQETLHNIRVELKKIKTIFHLINFCSKNFNASKEYKPLNKIFREAGKIRKVYLTEKLFLEHRIKFVKEATNINIENKLIYEFRQNISRYKNNIGKNYKSLEKNFYKVDINCYRKYLDIKKHKADITIYADTDESELHEARKIIKEIIYLSNISPSAKKNINPLYDEIQNVIGRWHDKQMLMKWLDKHYSASHDRDVEKLKSKCMIDLKEIKLMILKLYKKNRGFLSKHSIFIIIVTIISLHHSQFLSVVKNTC
ncbi:MAG: CHAD domain-containing protein [Bacteroidota bacterium]|nr:CHAD domain-containing protein [Bacteroidota bacterium]